MTHMDVVDYLVPNFANTLSAALSIVSYLKIPLESLFLSKITQRYPQKIIFKSLVQKEPFFEKIVVLRGYCTPWPYF